MRLDIAGPAGCLEALIDEGRCRPAAARAAVVFGHPHPHVRRHDAHASAVYQAAKGSDAHRLRVLRFNFRGVGRSEGTFDKAPAKWRTSAAALDFMAARYPDAPLWAAGFSFGSWIALTAGAARRRVSPRSSASRRP